MIVEHERSWIRLIFSFKGSILLKIWRRLTVLTLVGLAVAVAWETGVLGGHTLTPTPFTLVGFALSVFLGFRNSAAYDRFWEGRKLWGQLVNTSRTLTRQVTTLVAAPDEADREDVRTFQRAFVLRVAAFAHALRKHLRDRRDLSGLSGLLPEAETAALAREVNPPAAILQTLGEQLALAARRGWVDRYYVANIDRELTALAEIQGGCERIRSTPIPHAYKVLMHRTVAAYCFALPFGIVDQTARMTPLVVLLVSYAFLGLDGIGDELEEPFGLERNDLPLDALTRMIEVNLRQRLGDEALPPLLGPVDKVLT